MRPEVGAQDYYFRVSLCTTALLSVYGLSSQVNMNPQHLDDLWNILGESGDEQEIELFFDFLGKGIGIGLGYKTNTTTNVSQNTFTRDFYQKGDDEGASTRSIDAKFSVVAPEEGLRILMRYLCNPSLRWSLGEVRLCIACTCVGSWRGRLMTVLCC